jgi:hypothetical protein
MKKALAISYLALRMAVVAVLTPLLIGLPLVAITGCNGPSVAQQIVNWTPTIISAANVVATSVTVLDPQDRNIIAASVAGFDAGANLISTLSAAYLANPSQTTLQALETQVTTFQQTVDTAMLQAARIVNPASQQKVMLEIQAVAVGVNAILALLVSIKESNVTPASASAIKIAQITPLMDRNLTVKMVANHYQESETVASLRVSYAQYELAQAGF